MFRTRTFACLLLAWSLGISGAPGAGPQYEGRALPADAMPPWKQIFAGGHATLGENGLRVETTESQRHLYAIGQSAEGEPWGDATAWAFPEGTLSVTFRLRCEGEDPEAEVFRLIIRDGQQQGQVPFPPTAVYRKPTNTTEWDTYTAVIENGKLRLSSERLGLIVENRKSLEDNRGNGLLFGNYAYDKGGSTRTRLWELSFLRCTLEPSTPTP